MPIDFNTQFNSVLHLDNQNKFLLTTSLDRTVSQDRFWPVVKGFFGGGGYRKEQTAANIQKLFSAENKQSLLNRTNSELASVACKLEELQLRFARGNHPLAPGLFQENIRYLQTLATEKTASPSAAAPLAMGHALPSKHPSLERQETHLETAPPLTLEEKLEQSLLSEPEVEYVSFSAFEQWPQVQRPLALALAPYTSYIREETLETAKRLFQCERKKISPLAACQIANQAAKRRLLSTYGKELLLSTMQEMYKQRQLGARHPDFPSFLNAILSGEVQLDESVYRHLRVCCDKRQNDFVRFNAEGLSRYKKTFGLPALLEHLSIFFPRRKAAESHKLLVQGKMMFPMELFRRCRETQVLSF
jgi:hypothetical protein